VTAVSFGGRASSLLQRLIGRWLPRHADGGEVPMRRRFGVDEHARELVFDKPRAAARITGTTHEHNPGYDHDAMFAAIKAKLTEAQQLQPAPAVPAEEAEIPIDGDATVLVNLADLYDLEAVARARRIAPRID
jgi:hypothetical protein